MKKKLVEAHSLHWQRDKDDSENCSFFFVLLPHEESLALTKIHIYPEAPILKYSIPKWEILRKKDAVNAK